MTFAELLLLVAGGTVLYRLLTPLQRRLERHLMKRFFSRHPRVWEPPIDITDFTSHASRRKEDDTDERRS